VHAIRVTNLFRRTGRLRSQATRTARPRLGRFLQADPIGYTDDLDLYAYVGDDPIDRQDPTGETCTIASSGVVACQVDQWTDKNGNVTPSKDFTPAEKKVVAAFNRTYTKTVNALLKNSAGDAVVRGPDGKTTTVNAGELATTLEKQVFNVDAKSEGFEPNSPMDTPARQTNVTPSGLRAPPSGSAYGITGGAPSWLREVEITHEAIHAGYPWADNMWAGRSDFDLGHQEPYNIAAAWALQ
jgi:RHS repeat-associated protein